MYSHSYLAAEGRPTSWDSSLLYFIWFYFAAAVFYNYPKVLFTFAIHFTHSKFSTAHHHHRFPAPTTLPSQCLLLPFYSVDTVVQLLEVSLIRLHSLKNLIQSSKMRMSSIYPDSKLRLLIIFLLYIIKLNSDFLLDMCNRFLQIILSILSIGFLLAYIL